MNVQNVERKCNWMSHIKTVRNNLKTERTGRGESMEAHICYSVTKKCWNPYDSFGEICVGCGCCSDDPIKRAEARLKVSKDQLEDRRKFDMWDEDPEWRRKYIQMGRTR